MALTPARIDACARADHEGEKKRQRIRPFSVMHPGFTVEDAHAVQRRGAEITMAEGNTVNHPANGAAGLANAPAPFGEALGPGQFVLSGSFTGTVEARAGDACSVDCGPLGIIAARFV